MNSLQRRYISFEMVSRETLLVTGVYTAFTEPVKAAIKQHGGMWTNNSEHKGWMAAIDQYESLQTQIAALAEDCEIRTIPWFCFAVLRELGDELTYFTLDRKQHTISYTLSDQMKDAMKDLPKSLLAKLYDYQKVCVQHGIKQLGRILIADEMGVGKTVQSLALAQVYQESWPLLIICPTTLRLNWQDEVLQWVPRIESKDIQVISTSKQTISGSARVVIISYDLCAKFSVQLHQRLFKVAIVDEAHYLKAPNSQRSITCVPLLKHCKHVILLTGTPAFAKPKDLFNLVTIVRPDVFTNFRDFGVRYCDPKASRFTHGLDFEGASNLSELHYLLKSTIMIRRLKKDVLDQLPEKRRQRIRVQGDPKLTKQIQQMLGTVSNQIDRMAENAEEHHFEPTFMKCYQLTAKAKIKAVLDFLDDLLENEVKFIFFAHHMEMLDEVEQHCRERVNVIRIDGRVPHDQRHKNVHMFQERDDVRVAVLALTAASTGLTLTAASTIVFGEMHWTPATMMQAEDRAHRIGQQHNVDCVYLIGQDTIDDLLYSKLEKKLATVSHMVDGHNRQLDARENKDPAVLITSKNLKTQEGTKESSEVATPSYHLIPDPTSQTEIDEIFTIVEEIRRSKENSITSLQKPSNPTPTIDFQQFSCSVPISVPLDNYDSVDRCFQISTRINQSSNRLNDRKPIKMIFPAQPLKLPQKQLPQAVAFDSLDNIDTQVLKGFKRNFFGTQQQ